MTPAMFASFVAQQAAHRRRQMQAQAREVKPVKPDWRAMHWKQQVKTAQDMGADVTTTAEARAWLEANAG